MINDKGWIKIYRKMLDNPIVCKDADHYAVWSYLLLSATHKEVQKVFGKELVTLKPGQLITGRKKISSHFNISESKVNRVLKRLKIEQLIDQQTNNKGSLITIRNWEVYQIKNEQQNEQQLNNKWTTSEQQVNTNKNIKNKRNKECKNNIYIGEQAHRHTDQSEIDSAVENNDDSLKDKSYTVSNNEGSKNKSCTECKAIIDYLNQKLGSNYRTSTKATQRHIKARLNEGFKLDDFIAVIDVKYAEWKNTQFERFLRPITLFGTKFETYLNQMSKKSFVDNFDEKCKEIIDYLNKVSGYSYRHDSTQNRELINDLLVEGFKVDDFKTVIDFKKQEWKNTEWESYVRPKTLFKKDKFEDYLNEGLLAKKNNASSNGFTKEEYKAYVEQLRKENEEFEKKRKLEKRKNA